MPPGVGRVRAWRLSRIFGDVRPGEAPLVVWLALDLFLLLFTYYLLKTLREPLVAAGGVAGALVGARAAKWLYLHLSPYSLFLVAAACLMLALPFTWLANRAARRRPSPPLTPISRAGALGLLVSDPYLMCVGG